MNLVDLFNITADMGGSDLHLSVGSPPRIRVNGRLRPLDLPNLMREIAEHAERHFVRTALDRSAGRTSEAARLLGITEHALQAGLQRLNIGPSAPSEDAPPRAS